MGQDWQLKHRCKHSPSQGPLLIIHSPFYDLFPFRGLVQGPEATSYQRLYPQFPHTERSNTVGCVVSPRTAVPHLLQETD